MIRAPPVGVSSRLFGADVSFGLSVGLSPGLSPEGSFMGPSVGGLIGSPGLPGGRAMLPPLPQLLHAGAPQLSAQPQSFSRWKRPLRRSNRPALPHESQVEPHEAHEEA